MRDASTRIGNDVIRLSFRAEKNSKKRKEIPASRLSNSSGYVAFAPASPVPVSNTTSYTVEFTEPDEVKP